MCFYHNDSLYRVIWTMRNLHEIDDIVISVIFELDGRQKLSGLLWQYWYILLELHTVKYYAQRIVLRVPRDRISTKVSVCRIQFNILCIINDKINDGFYKELLIVHVLCKYPSLHSWNTRVTVLSLNVCQPSTPGTESKENLWGVTGHTTIRVLVI